MVCNKTKLVGVLLEKSLMSQHNVIADQMKEECSTHAPCNICGVS